uniref:Uncharacterized protein n=1 Tax=Bosea sp. NBC_00436 TaxID=2969620 RepID=A0A9E8A390_9HYPH
MIARASWLGNDGFAWAGSGLPRLRRPAQIEPWKPEDGQGYVIRRQDADGSVVFFISNPPSWTMRWRAASRFEGRAEAAALIAPKTATTPAGPAAEIGAEIVKLQNGFPG